MGDRSDAQKKADKAYRDAHRGEYKVFQTGFKVEECIHIEDVMRKNGIGKAELIRRAVARLERGEEL